MVQTDAEFLGMETDPKRAAKIAPSELGNVGTTIFHYDPVDKQNNIKNPKPIGKYLQGPFLGKGGFAKVY